MAKALSTIFKITNVRRLYAGDLCLFLGLWISFLNITWVTYKLGGTPLQQGIAGMLLNLPLLFILPVGGVIADRFNKKIILSVGSAGMMILPIVLGLGEYLHFISLHLVYIMAPVYGFFCSLTIPATSAYIPELVTNPNQVHRVTGVISANTKAAQFVSSSLNGIFYLFLNTAGVFMISAIVHLCSVFNFARINKPFVKQPHHDVHPFKQLKEGFKYVFSFSPYWSVVLVAAIANLGVISMQWFYPVFAKTILHGDIHTLSYLFIGGGGGGILSGIYIGARKSSRNLMKLANLALFVIGLSMIVFAMSKIVWLTIIAGFFMDGGLVIVLATCAATLLAITEADKHGRVMSLYAMGVFGLLSVSSLLMGLLNHWLGVVRGVSVIGAICILMVIFYMAMYNHWQNLLSKRYDALRIDFNHQPI